MNKPDSLKLGLVYEPILQPIPQRTPIMTTWWGFAYLVAEKWNRDMLSASGGSALRKFGG